MRITKKKLIIITKAGIENLGYKEIQDTITVAQGLYIKLIENGLYLSIGLTISRYHDSMFTASFYLSKTTNWATYGGDIPKQSYQRVGHLLTKEERNILLDEKYTKDGINDAWWNAQNQKEVNNFIKTLNITEKRFLNQANLMIDIQNSKDVNELGKLAKMVIHKVDHDNIDKFNYQFIPKKPIDNIPIEWFKAAEIVIKSENAVLNINTVKLLAADAYRQRILISLTGASL